MNTARLSPERAVGCAFWMVNLPVLAVMFGPGLALLGIGSLLDQTSQLAAAIKLSSFATFVVCWPFAWLTWSILTPRWRVWAYERVQDIEGLKRLAVKAGVICPEGHFFQRTEIRPPELRRRLEELEANR